MSALFYFVSALALAPLLPGIINRVKAFFAGRTGQSPFQLYYDLAKLLRKAAVYGSVSGIIFRAAPAVSLAAVVCALSLAPAGADGALFGFAGDMVLLAYLLGLSRFATILAALDTGSSFEAMGASREALFSSLSEPAFFMALAVLVKKTGELSLSAALASASPVSGTALLLCAGALFLVFLAENCRIPVDDPNTHLELTMIHEVMVLDHCGPDFALISYAASLKLWLFGSLIARLVLPPETGAAAFFAAVSAVAICAGIVESCMARLRLLRVPAMLLSALVLGFAAFMAI